MQNNMPENDKAVNCISEMITERLFLRRFSEQDAEAMLGILKDREVNTYLPWYPVTTLKEAENFLQEHYLNEEQGDAGFHFAVCLKTDKVPIGYVKVGGPDSYDLGYGLRKEFWKKGIITEACREVVRAAKQAGIPYLTATHDVLNPRSGRVMQRLGMTYRYSYEELWQPKNILVTFRMYQINFTPDGSWTYKKYWDRYPVHFIEDLGEVSEEENFGI